MSRYRGDGPVPLAVPRRRTAISTVASNGEDVLVGVGDDALSIRHPSIAAALVKIFNLSADGNGEDNSVDSNAGALGAPGALGGGAAGGASWSDDWKVLIYDKYVYGAFFRFPAATCSFFLSCLLA
jgi:hypothetical protein